MGQFVSNPTYIRWAILCFYVIFSRLFVASLFTMILLLLVASTLPFSYECLHRIGNRQESKRGNFLYSEHGIIFEISRGFCCSCCCCCVLLDIYALFVRRNFCFVRISFSSARNCLQMINYFKWY